MPALNSPIGRDDFGRFGIVDGIMFWRAPDGRRIAGKLTDFEGSRCVFRVLRWHERALWWFTGPMDLPKIERLWLRWSQPPAAFPRKQSPPDMVLGVCSCAVCRSLRNDGAAGRGIIARIRGLLLRRDPAFITGSIYRPEDGYRREKVRLNTKTGRVEFVLWRAGEQGHAEDFWHPMGPGWEEHFVEARRP